MIRALIIALAALLLGSAAPQPDYRILKIYPHDSTAFTQGLFYLDGSFYESTGQYGASDIRQVRIKDGKVLRRVAIDRRMFGEGIAPWGDQILSLTWMNKGGFRWRRSDFTQIGVFTYEGEGWGLTQDGQSMIMSDGTPILRFLDPETMTEKRQVTVTDNGQPVMALNELEFVKGEVLANVWHSNLIARIDPASGAVKGWIDLTPIVESVKVSDPEDSVLNGIAYDAKRDRIYVTGKYWPKLFELKLR